MSPLLGSDVVRARPWFRRLNADAHRKIQRFLDEGGTGSIQINVADGTPKTAIVKEHVRIATRDGPPAPYRPTGVDGNGTPDV
ncbi:MAG: hypothetical protein R3344_13885 [Acidobacteriota bacterium]|nr:hypothetical protein [Acidobacteriota bacterium]